MGVDTIAVEDAVAGHAVRAELLAQPGHRAPRAVHLLTYRLPDVHFFCHRYKVVVISVLKFVLKPFAFAVGGLI